MLISRIACVIKFKQYDQEEMRVHKFVRVINKVLLLHNGPILSFFLNFIPMCKSRIIHDYVDQWIPLLSRKGMKQLTVEDYVQEKFVATHHFSTLELSHLRLADAYLPCPRAFKGFTYLRKLELIDVNSRDDFIFDCPVLEMLTLVICDGLWHDSFRAPNLKCFRQMYRELYLQYSLDGLETLEECTLMLTQDPMMQTYPMMQTETSNVVKVLGSLHKVEKFSTRMFFIKYLAAGGSPIRLPKPLLYLKTLNISDIDFTLLSEVSCLLCLIRSAPNLCKLHISATPNAVEENLEKCWVEDSEDCTFNHLESVTFSYFKGLKAELELVKFLLAHSPSLKTMLIHCSADIKKDVELIMAEEKWQYSRASSKEQIRYLKQPVRIAVFGPWVERFNLSD